MGKSVNNDIEEIDPNVPLVDVRFINTVSGKDIVTTVPLGANLLVVGKRFFFFKNISWVANHFKLAWQERNNSFVF